MQGGDLSNRTSPYIAFDMDSLLYLPEDASERSVITRIKDIFTSTTKQYTRRKFNEAFTNYLRELYKKTDYNIVLLTNELDEGDLKELQEVMDQNFIPFSNMSSYEKWGTVSAFCDHAFMYFFTNNEALLSVLSRKNAIKFDRVREVLG